MSSLLEAKGLYGGYGGADILQGTNLRVEADEIVVIVGPNGAGKSTAMKAVFGLLRIREGEVRYRGETINNAKPEQMVRRGIAYVPQEKNVFPSLTVRENLEMGAYLMKGDLSQRLDKVYTLFPKLAERRRQQAGLMSGGERQMVAMGRALMIDPQLQGIKWIKNRYRKTLNIIRLDQKSCLETVERLSPCPLSFPSSFPLLSQVRQLWGSAADRKHARGGRPCDGTTPWQVD